jgi:serine protease AprX
MGPGITVRLLLLLLLSVLVTGCARPVEVAPPSESVVGQPAPDLRESEDVVNRVFGARIGKARVSEFTATDVPASAFSRAPFEKTKDEKPVRDVTPSKIHPLLERWLRSRPGSEVETIVVNFRDDIRIPRFPEPAATEPRDSPKNTRALERAAELVRDVQARRAASYRSLVDELKGQYRADIVEEFWLVRALTVRIPLAAVRSLAARPDVIYLEPDRTEDIPPQNSNTNDDVDDGRGRITSDPYFNLGLTGGWIGLLDSGVRFTHVQFNSPSHIDFRRDCVNGGADCNTGTNLNPNDDCWSHGTSSAGIVTGNARQGNAFRGVTAITLDSFKVYPSTTSGNTCTGNLNTTAAVRGFQRAVSVLDRVIVAEIQSSGDYLGTIAVAADNAFDAGAVVIAANGNNGPNAGTVNAPASAHRAIGIGNFDVQSQAQITGQSRGPTPDNRFKPDVQAPTNTETASTGCAFSVICTQSDTGLRNFGGTSGATPYGAGAAALLRNWLRGTSFSIDPGQVYAHLILSGQQPYPFNNTSGAGPLRLPTDGWAWWGKVSVRDGDTIEIPLPLTLRNLNRFDAALWWPEYAFQLGFVTLEFHNDVDLAIIDPTGAVRGSSISIPSVFERARATGSIPTGTWKVRIRGFNVPLAPQTVYWAAAAHRQ